MYDLEQLEEDFASKKKSVQDLIRFIKNRTDENPNYSLFLGAGCSVTSGIRSGAQLIKDWKKEIYLASLGGDSKENEENYNDKDADKFLLSKSQRSWFDPRNEYSSLFEKKYDLPKQRRAFVEREVEKREPSIGYAYLVKLIEQSYFRTVFTTNFDDLINQAFYNYSNKARPIVCAHDSSINSVTVTSTRPKIIKLHGDYLFDDIKSTLRETESLEENMKNKFSEFSKEYGLIVVGYGGNDRSVMDVLNYLLKHEDYLGQGIYWCLRKGDTIGDELKKLFWREKVYFVVIDGFDELMAEINKSAAEDKPLLPFESKLQVDPQVIMEDIQRYKKAFSDNEIIRADLEECENNINSITKSNFFKTLEREIESNREEHGSDPDYSIEEMRAQWKIRQLSMDKKYDEAISEINKNLETSQSASFKSELMSWKSSVYRDKKDNSNAILALKKLVEFDAQNEISNNVNNYLRLMGLTHDQKEKIEYCEKAIEQDPYFFRSYYHKAKAIRALNEDLLEEKPTDGQVVDTYKKSIELNPHIENKAYFEYLDYLIGDGESSTNIEEAKRIIKDLEVQDPFDVNLFIIQLKLLNKTKADLSEIKSFAEGVIHGNKNPRLRFILNFELLKSVLKIDTLESLEDQFEKIEREYLHSQDVESKDNFYRVKARFFLRRRCDLDTATETLEKVVSDRKNVEDDVLAELGTYYLYQQRFDEAQETLSKIQDQDYSVPLKIDVLQTLGKHDDVDTELDATANENSKKWLVRKSYNLLKMEKYQETIDLLKPHLEANCFKDRVLVINYELARKELNSSHSLKRLGKISESDDKLYSAAAHAIMSKSKTDTHMEECKKRLNDLLDENFENFYQFKVFPVFSKIDFSKLDRSSGTADDKSPKLKVVNA